MGSGFGFHPANPGWGGGACVFVCALCLPRHSWLVVTSVGVCALVRVALCPAVPGCGCWGVCFSARSPPVPRLSWLRFVVCAFCFRLWLSGRLSRLGCSGLCGCVRAPPVPRQSWLGCAGSGIAQKSALGTPCTLTLRRKQAMNVFYPTPGPTKLDTPPPPPLRPQNSENTKCKPKTSPLQPLES